MIVPLLKHDKKITFLQWKKGFPVSFADSILIKSEKNADNEHF